MPASNAIAAWGTLLKLGDGAGTEVFTTIAEVRDIDLPEFTMEVTEVTHHTSPGAWREKIASLLDAGELSMTIGFLPTDATQGYSTGILRDQVNRTKRNFRLVFPNTAATTWTFPAYVTSFQVHAPVAEDLTADITLTLAGAPTLA
jgi:predicted secreted protein